MFQDSIAWVKSESEESAFIDPIQVDSLKPSVEPELQVVLGNEISVPVTDPVLVPACAPVASAEEAAPDDDDDDGDGFRSNSPRALEMHLNAYFNQWLFIEGVTELALNKPGEVFLMRAGKWELFKTPSLTTRVVEKLGRCVANRVSKALNESNTTLSTSLPDGTRIEITGPPTTADKLTYVNMRRHIYKPKYLEDFESESYFIETRHVVHPKMTAQQREDAKGSLTKDQLELWSLAVEKKWVEFLKFAVRSKQNIIASGSTGSGKTTFVRGLAEVIPFDERILTVEDTPEMPLPHHHNVQALFYRRDSVAGAAGANAKEVLQATMRKTPDRVLLAELRGDETFYYLQSVLNSGHPGGLTTTHANCSLSSFMRLALLIKASHEGSGLHLDEIQILLSGLVHVVVQIVYDTEKGRHCPEIYYDPFYSNSKLA